MYIAISTLGKKVCGEAFIMRRDELFDEVGVYEIGGGLVGYVADKSPDGCLAKEFVKQRIGICRVVCTGAVAFDNMLIVSTDSPTLSGGDYRLARMLGCDETTCRRASR
ncbi:MAG: hypothetical protein HFK09_06680 [Clostridia bacterium]|nr:hypothetical protein [Clostridia bacterium]